MESVQPIVRAAFADTNTSALVLCSRNNHKLGYHVFWPDVALPSRVVPEFVEFLYDRPSMAEYQEQKDLQVYVNMSLRMHLCDKPFEKAPMQRPYRFHSTYDQRGRLDQSSAEVNDSLTHLLQISALTSINAYGPTTDPTGEFAKATTYRRAHFLNNRRVESIRNTGRINLSEDTHFCEKTALEEFNAGKDVEDSLDRLVRYMNRFFGVITEQGSLQFVKKIVTERGFPGLDVKNKNDFLASLEHVKVNVGEKQDRSIGCLWTNHVNRGSYAKRVFNPFPAGHREAARAQDLNLFYPEGMATVSKCEPFKDADHSLITRHIRETWADNNEESYNYIMDWWAFCAQHPEMKPETCLTLKGPEGNGKSSFVQRMAEIVFGPFSLSGKQSV